jgi:DNA-binding MarR family transcriptional regulator
VGRLAAGAAATTLRRSPNHRPPGRRLLAEQSPARVGDLAVRRRPAPSTVSGLIGQMIGTGLVAREVDPA